MKTSNLRRRIAHEAARLIAEDGSLDYGLAKRKAARQLGALGHNLPDNREIEEALRSYQALYQGESQRNRLALLRAVAAEYMEQFADFNPHLTGSVLNGTAGRYSDINLELFTDNEKEFEFSLLNRRYAFKRGEVRVGGKTYPHYTLEDYRANIEITVYPSNELRQMRRSQADGSPHRIRLTQVRSLLKTEN